jgi:large subunit ribosomal protein L13
MNLKSFSASSKNVIRKWYYIDATGKILGRLSSVIAHYLRGKHKKIYTPHIDVGDYIIVINASKIQVTGKKVKKKIYYRYTGYPGGLKQNNFSDMLFRFPKRIIQKSVFGMLPKGPLGRLMFKKLKIYSGLQHNNNAQKPIFLNI